MSGFDDLKAPPVKDIEQAAIETAESPCTICGRMQHSSYDALKACLTALRDRA